MNERTKNGGQETVCNRKFAWIAVLFLAALGVALPAGDALAQTVAGGATGAVSTAPPVAAGPSHGREIDLPVEGPLEGFAEEEPEDPPDEDDDVIIYDEEIPTETDSLIFVLDISGSMGWDYTTFTGLDGQPVTGNKLDRAKVELVRSISALTSEFKLNVIAYDCDMRRLWTARRDATPANKAAASTWIGSLRPMGATGTGPATALALQERENLTVVLLSDGAPNCVGTAWADIPQHRQMIRANNVQGAVIHCFGILAYGEFEAFLRDVAGDSGGRYYPVN